MMYRLIRPFIFTQDPEDAHDKAIEFGKYLNESFLKKYIAKFYNYENQILNTNIYGINFKNPVGLAAGFDKNAELIDFLPALGFGYTEIGSVTAGYKFGNEKPRLFRLPKDKAVINRMGLNSLGVKRFCENLRNIKHEIPVGINITKTHDPNMVLDEAKKDICSTFTETYKLADYITLNISCPNTKEGKTFEDPRTLDEVIYALRFTELQMGPKKPLFVKVSPDLTYERLDSILSICEYHGIQGYVIGNTSSFRQDICTSQEELELIGKGGLSGQPIKKKSTDMIKYVYKRLDKPIIIGTGGIMSAEDAYEKICVGASLVQVLTGLVYEGPGLVKSINKGLVKLLERDGFKSLTEAVGSKNQ